MRVERSGKELTEAIHARDRGVAHLELGSHVFRLVVSIGGNDMDADALADVELLRKPPNLELGERRR